jgi:hypothetical protein
MGKKMMKIQFEKIELELLLETLNSAVYKGVYARIVAKIQDDLESAIVNIDAPDNVVEEYNGHDT